jgi:hypothetical protein
VAKKPVFGHRTSEAVCCPLSPASWYARSRVLSLPASGLVKANQGARSDLAGARRRGSGRFPGRYRGRVP